MQSGGDRAVDGRVHDRLEVATRLRVVEHDRPQLSAIDGRLGCKHAGSEARRDRGGRLGARGLHAVDEGVRVEAGNATSRETDRGRSSSRRDAAGERHSQHAITGPSQPIPRLLGRGAPCSSAAWRS